MVDKKIYTAGFDGETMEMNKKIAAKRLKLKHKHSMAYLVLGMIFIIIGSLNFLIGYMFFEAMLMKTFSISVIFVLAGIIIFAIGDQEMRYTRKEMKKLEM